MTWAIRRISLAAAAAALITSQAAYAGPVATRAAGIDPLVALSALATVQSSAAVCGAGTAATAGAAAAAQAAAPGCILPVTGAPVPAPVVEGVPPPPPPVVGVAAAPKAFGVLPLVIGLAAIVALAAALAAGGGGKGKGDLTPVSPA